MLSNALLRKLCKRKLIFADLKFKQFIEKSWKLSRRSTKNKFPTVNIAMILCKFLKKTTN
jgi:hypothetical protein